VQIYSDFNTFKSKKPVVTVGFFDGVHLGHAKILNALIENAKKAETESVVFTFWPHPQFVINAFKDEIKLLNTIDEKIELLKFIGIDHLIIQPFTKELSEMPSHDFVKNILCNKLKIHTLIVGYDNHFGKNKDGDYNLVKKYSNIYNFRAIKVGEESIDNVNISSTKIRDALISGEIERANLYLGYNYTFTGLVVNGNKIGQTIGFPTANLEIEEKYKLIPADGVYAVEVIINNIKYFGLFNKGKRPTLGNSHITESIEVHILDFDKNIYGEKIKVKFVKKIRDELKFENIDLLKEQIIKDKGEALKIFRI
jgi:riboflavin kinase / FMN adenylyltransferase